GSTRRVILKCAGAGFFIALFICVFAFYLTRARTHFDIDTELVIQRTLLIVCPSCIGLMAMDYVQSWVVRVVFILIIGIKNVRLFLALSFQPKIAQTSKNRLRLLLLSHDL